MIRDVIGTEVVDAAGEAVIRFQPSGRPAAGYEWRLVQCLVVDRVVATVHAAAVAVVTKGDVTRAIGVLRPIPGSNQGWGSPPTVLESEEVDVRIFGAAAGATLLATLQVDEVRKR